MAAGIGLAEQETPSEFALGPASAVKARSKERKGRRLRMVRSQTSHHRVFNRAGDVLLRSFGVDAAPIRGVGLTLITEPHAAEQIEIALVLVAAGGFAAHSRLRRDIEKHCQRGTRQRPLN